MKPAAKGCSVTASPAAAAASSAKRVAQSCSVQGAPHAQRPLRASGGLGYMDCINAAAPASSHYR